MAHIAGHFQRSFYKRCSFSLRHLWKALLKWGLRLLSGASRVSKEGREKPRAPSFCAGGSTAHSGSLISCARIAVGPTNPESQTLENRHQQLSPSWRPRPREPTRRAGLKGWSSFVVDDDICIVDPRTYVVVDVIDAGYWSAPGRPYVAGLRLSVREMDVVREGIPADFPDAGIHLRLALGAEIPEDIQLHEFAPFVLDRLPKLRGYAFLVTGDQIVIVQPHDRSIALVIDRA